MDSTEELLTQAIRARRVVAARYGGTATSGVRVFYPHVLYHSSAGGLLLDAYQVEGATTSARLPEWRVFKIDQLRDVELQDAVFPLPQLDLDSPRYRRKIVVHCLLPDRTS